MPRDADYPNIVSGYRKRSVLPVSLQASTAKLAQEIRANRGVDACLAAYVAELKLLPCGSVERAGDDIRDMADLWHDWSPERPKSALRRWFSRPPFASEQAALKQYPALAYLYLFHGNGHLREAALEYLPGPLDNPFAFAAVAARLNDWAAPVREAACAAADRLFPNAPADIVAQASFVLLPRLMLLQRWGEPERDRLEAALYRPDAMEAFAARLKGRPTGEIVKIMHAALRKESLDAALNALAKEAVLPHVRAIAYETLIMRRARWVAGYDYAWIDKRYGKRARVRRYAERPLEHQFDIERLIADAAHDRAVAVRCVAAQALIDLRQTLSLDTLELGKLLANDAAASVRSRAEFLLKKLSSE